MKKQLIYLIISMSMFCGCATDTQVAGPDPKGGMNATISLRVAGGAAPTRAMNAAAENSIDHIDILVFAKSAATADADAMFDYRAETTLVGDAASDTSGATKNFRVSLRRSADADDLQKLVVLANCHAFFNAADFEGKTFVQVMDMLVIECSTAWNSASTTYDPLPMWGEMSDFRQLSAPSSVPASIGLLRVHAAVDLAGWEGRGGRRFYPHGGSALQSIQKGGSAPRRRQMELRAQ